MRDADERETLLEEIAEHRRAHPFVTVFIVAKAINNARLGHSASVADLDDRALRDLVATLRAYARDGVLP